MIEEDFQQMTFSIKAGIRSKAAFFSEWKAGGIEKQVEEAEKKNDRRKYGKIVRK